MTTTLKQVLTIAGSDSGGGAGIQADIKAMSANGVFAMSVLTAITAQNTEEVTEVFELPTSIIAAQIDAVAEDFEVAAVKTGMFSQMTQAHIDFMLSKIPKARFVLVEELAAMVAWLPLGAHVWLLTWAVGGDPLRSLGPAVGAYALAWTLGLLVVFAPAGLGVREVVLVVALAPVVDAGAALVVAVLSRLVMTVADVGWAGLAVLVSRAPAPEQERNLSF